MRLCSALMAIVFFIALTLPVLATPIDLPTTVILSEALTESTVTYRSSQGITLSIVTETPEEGIVISHHYSDGVYRRTETFEKIDDTYVLYTVTDGDVSTQEIITVSDYVTCTHSESAAVASISNSFFRGNIFYNPKVHNGVSYARTLGIYYELTDGDHDTYTINGGVGKAVSFIANLIVAAFGSGLDAGWLTSFLTSAFADKIIDGYIVSPITEDVLAYNSYYTIYATDVASGYTTEHTGSAHQVDIPGRRNEYYFHGGYLPFGNNTVAYNLFQKHWPNDWTGVSSYYSAYPGMVI